MTDGTSTRRRGSRSVGRLSRSLARFRSRFPRLLRTDFWATSCNRGFWTSLFGGRRAQKSHSSAIATSKRRARSAPKNSRPRNRPSPRYRKPESLRMETLEARQLLTAVTFTGFYSEDFDTLPATGTTSAWVNDSTLEAWSLFNKDGDPLDLLVIRVADGSSTNGSFYSFGPTGGSDRGLGGIGSNTFDGSSVSAGTVAGWIAVALTNSTGSTIDTLNLTYDGEQWRNGGNETMQTMVLEYGFGTAFADVPEWAAPGGGFDFTSPVHTAIPGALDGNAEANRVAGLGGTIANLDWTDGSTLWVRWVETNDVDNNHGLAIDNLSITAPAPLEIDATGTPNLKLVVNGANLEVIDTDNPGAPLSSTPLNSIAEITINGTDGGNETVTLDFSAGDFIPAGGLTFNGGAGDNDALVLTGGSFDAATYTFDNANDGSISLDGSTIHYTGLDPITSSIAADVVELIYTGDSETITVSDAGGSQTTVASTLGESLTFANPTDLLKITATGGTDTIDIDSLASDYTSIEIAGDDNSDVVNVNGAVALAADKNLIVGLDVVLSSDGLLAGSGSITGDVTGSGTIKPGASPGTLTITGNLIFSGELEFEINDPAGTAGTDYDQIVVSGDVDLSGATLTIVNNATADPTAVAITLVQNDGANPTITDGATAPADATIYALGSIDYELLYNGGDGNDVVLAVVASNTPPTVDDQSFSVDEDDNGSAVFATVVATDAESGVTFAITGGTGMGVFNIDQDTGELSVASPLDFESTASYTLEVTVTDAGDLTDAATITINLNDVDEFDVTTPVDNDAAGNEVAENAPVDTLVGITAFAEDQDGSNNSVTYTLIDAQGDPADAGGLFKIDANTGVISVAVAGLDYETATSHTITVRATSADGSTAHESFTITVLDVNEPPVVQPLELTTEEDTPLEFVLTEAVAFDPEGGPLTIVPAASNPEIHGTLSGSGTQWTFTPAADYFGTATFAFEVTDDANQTEVLVVTVEVTPVDDPPVIGHVVNAVEDTPLEFSLPVFDPDGGTLSVVLLESHSDIHGTLTGSDTQWTYTPDANYFGSATFEFLVTSSNGQAVRLRVTAIVAPVLDDSAVSTPEDTPITVQLDPAGPGSEYEIVSGPLHGTLSAISGGMLTYTPAANYYGADSFTYRSNLTNNVATVSMDISPVNDAPVLDSIGDQSIESGSIFTVTATASDVDTLAAVVKFLSGSGALRGSGVLISPIHVLTAAHVAQSISLGNPVVFASGQATRTVAGKVVHPDYQPQTSPFQPPLNDIAIITLDAPVAIEPLALYRQQNEAGLSALLAGFGGGQFHYGPNNVHQVAGSQLTFVVDQPGEFAIVTGDSGSPALINGMVAGIAFVATGDGNTYWHSRVSNYLPFIEEHVDLESMPAASGPIFSLIDAPEGAAIDPAYGIITWEPGADQEAGVYPFTVRVTDSSAADVWDERSFQVTLIEPIPIVDVVIDDNTSVEFIESLDNITGSLTITASARTSLSLPNLVSVAGDLMISATNGLEGIDAPLLQSVGGTLIIADNLMTETVEFDSLTQVNENFIVSGNASLTSLNVPTLTQIQGSFIVDGNPLLESLVNNELSHVGGIGIIANNSLTDIDLPALEGTLGSLLIASNPSLSSVSLPAVSTVSQDLRVNDNLLLSELNFQSLIVVLQNIVLTDNASLTGLNFQALAAVGMNAEIIGNASLVVGSFPSLTHVNGNFEFLDNQAAVSLLLPNLQQVREAFTVEVADSVKATTAKGSTSISLASAQSSLQVDLPGNTFPFPAAFEVNRLQDAALAAKPGADATGALAMIDPLAAYRLAFSLPLINQQVSLSFELNVSELTPAEQIDLLTALAIGTATVAVKSNAPTSSYQALALAAPGEPADVNQVAITLFDDEHNPLPEDSGIQPTYVRFDVVATSLSTFAVAVVKPPLAGDFDLDGDVDGADFVAWQTNFPTATGATLADGDADGDGDVDGADFVVWQTNFPTIPAPAVVSAEASSEGETVGLAMDAGFDNLSRLAPSVDRESAASDNLAGSIDLVTSWQPPADLPAFNGVTQSSVEILTVAVPAAESRQIFTSPAPLAFFAGSVPDGEEQAIGFDEAPGSQSFVGLFAGWDQAGAGTAQSGIEDYRLSANALRGPRISAELIDELYADSSLDPAEETWNELADAIYEDGDADAEDLFADLFDAVLEV